MTISQLQHHSLTSNPLNLPFNKRYAVVTHLCYQRKSLLRTLNGNIVGSFNSDWVFDLIALQESFCLKNKTRIEWPQIVNDITIRDAVKQFPDYTADIFKYLNLICDYCSYFINSV